MKGCYWKGCCQKAQPYMPFLAQPFFIFPLVIAWQLSTLAFAKIIVSSVKVKKGMLILEWPRVTPINRESIVLAWNNWRAKISAHRIKIYVENVLPPFFIEVIFPFNENVIVDATCHKWVPFYHKDLKILLKSWWSPHILL